MVKLRKSCNKLKIVLCSVLGSVTSLGGVAGIYMLDAALQPSKSITVPDNLTNYVKELPAGVTYSSLCSTLSASSGVSGLDNIGYMAYVLQNQGQYHAYSLNTTTAMGVKQCTATFKDYKVTDGVGVMISTDTTYGSPLVKGAMQSCYIIDVDGTGVDGAGVYRREYSGSVSSSSTPASISWDNDSEPVYYADSEKYDESVGYYYTYGAYSTEMTVYLLNEETVESWDDVICNGDGTYTQTYYLDAEKAAYFYQFLMKKNGGLSDYPTFKSITLTITFDDSYRVLETVAHEETEINKYITMSSSSTTVTTFSYDENDFDDGNFGFYESYFKDYVGKLESGGGTSSTTDGYTKLLAVFSDLLTTTGQQFDIELTLGKKTYYGALFLSVDFDGISGGTADVTSAIVAKLALSADKTLDSQDLYIEYSNGNLNCYYSTGFAITADISQISSVVSGFTDFINSFTVGGKSTQTMSATTTSSSDSILDELLAMLAEIEVAEDENGNGTLTLDLDLYGVSASVTISYTVSGDTYKFKSAAINNISYNGEDLELSLELTAGSTTPSHNSSSAALDLSTAAEDILELLKANSLGVEITLQGSGLETFLAGLTDLTDINSVLNSLGTSLADLKLTISGNVDIDGVTVSAGITLKDSTTTYLDATVYYDYDGKSAKYGKAYLNITTIYGNTANIKVCCDISELSTAVTQLIAAFNDSTATSTSSSSSLTLASIINSVLSVDLGDTITDLYANGTAVGATLNVDKVLAALGIDSVKVGDIVLSYTLGTSGGTLKGSVAELGLTATVTGSSYTVCLPTDTGNYLDLTSAVTLITDAKTVADSIAEAGSVYFDIETEIAVGNETVSAEGEGEIEWDKGGAITSVALALTFKANDAELEFVFIYNAESENYVTIAIGKSVFTYTRSQINNLTSSLQTLSGYVDGLLNGDNAAETLTEIMQSLGYASTLSGGGSGAISDDTLNIIAVIAEQLNGDGILGTLVKQLISGTTVSISEYVAEIQTSISTGSYVLGGSLSVGVTYTDGDPTGYTLTGWLNFADGGSSIVGASVSVTAKAGGAYKTYGSYAEYLAAQLTDSNGYTIKTYNSLIDYVWNLVFAALDSDDIAAFLGSNTYSVNLYLNGTSSGISQLDGVTVDATLYFGKVSTGGTKLQAGTLVQLDITELTVSGFTLAANVIYNKGTFYVSVTKVNGVTLNDLNVSISSDSLYTAVQSLISLLGNDAVLNVLSGVFSSEDEAEATSYVTALAESGQTELTESQSSVADVLSGLLSLKFNEVAKVYNSDGSTIVAIDIDKILSTLGITGVSVGSAQVSVGTSSGNTTVKASLINGDTTWAYLKAVKTTGSISTSVDATTYYDINFIVNLIKDAATFISSNTNTLYTFYQSSLSINVSVSVISTSITIKNLYLTVGIDDSGEFMVSMSGELQKTTYLSFTLSTAATIGFTYYNGYITLVRDSEYIVMTADYLLDNLFDGEKLLKWYLGMSSTVWGILSSFLPDLSSGASDPDELYLYDTSSNSGANSDGEISIFDYILGYFVSIGSYTSSAGDYSSALSNLGLTSSSDYYAFAINASDLTGGTLTALDVAIIRNDTTGIGGLKAYANISGYVSISLDMTYSSAYTAVTNHFTAANDKVDGGIDFNYYEKDGNKSTEEGYTYVFGSYNTQSKVYSCTKVLDSDYVTVKIYDENSNLIETTTLTKGSTIYLHSAMYPITDDSGTTYIYVVKVDGKEVTDEDTYPVESYDVGTSKEVYVYKVKASDYKIESVSITVHDNTSNTDYSLNVYAGTTLDDLMSEMFSGYVVDGKWTIGNSTYESSYAIQSADNGATLYVSLARSSVTINGVIYTFYYADGTGTDGSTAANNTDKSHYEISGHTNSIVAYYQDSTILILENEIDGYAVTAIRSNALANDINETSGLQTVIIPANITYVGTNAFLDNYGMQTAIFLADEVTLAGSVSDKSFPFYGCSTASGGTTSSLTVYFNSINGSSTSLSSGTSGDWNHYRYTSGVFGLGSKNYYFTAYGKGAWAYIDLSVIKVDDYTSDELAEMVIAYLSENDYSYDNTVYNATGCLFVTGLSSENLTTADDIYKLIENAINAYSTRLGSASA